MASKGRELGNIVSPKTGIAVTISGDPVVLGVGNTEHFRITGAGLVGIGTDGPGSLVHALGSYGTVRVENNNTAQYAASGVELKGPAGDERSTKIIHGNSNTGGTETYFQIEQYNAAGSYVKTLSQYNYEYNYWVFNTGGTERVRITSAGLVGIGTDGPATPLSVAIGSSTFEVHPHLDSGTTLTSFNRTSNAWQDLRLRGYSIKLSPQGNEKARVTSTGLGIGLTGPSTLLHLSGDQPKLRIESTNALSDTSGTEEIGRIEWQGIKNTNKNVAASIRVRQDGTWSTVTPWLSPTAIEFYTQDDSSSEITTPRTTINQDGLVTVNSGYVTLNSNQLGAIQVLIADDAFATITPPRIGGGWVFLTTSGDSTYPYSVGYARAYLDWGTSPQVSAQNGGTDVATSTAGPPNGTTGTDGKVTIFVGGTAGKLYIENRLDGSKNFQLTFI